MTAEWMGLDVGAWADWAGAVGGLASAGFGIAALRTARGANDLAARVAGDEAAREQARDLAADARERELDRKEDLREQRARERERLEIARAEARDRREDDLRLRSLAASLQAWWAKTDSNDWGVLVLNAGNGAAVLHEVSIDVTGSLIERPIKIPHLPPGCYFVQSTGQSWPFPEPIRDMQAYTPITGGAKHSVDRMTFRDPLGQRWSWTPEGGLVSASADSKG